MKMSQRFITLPNRGNMLKRLLRVSDELRWREHFYPLLLEYAGLERSSVGIASMLVTAICDYKGLSLTMSNAIYLRVHQFIDALVRDPRVAKEAKYFLHWWLLSVAE